MAIDKAQLLELMGVLGDKIKDILLAGGGAFLDKKITEGKDFLKEEMKDAAYWTVELAKAKDDAHAAAIQSQLDRIKARVIDALWAAAVDASAETKATLKTIVTTIFEYAVKVLPQVIGIVAAARKA